MSQLKCIIIDDDEIDRLTVLSYVKKFSFINILGVFSSAIEALNSEFINEADILFSDIDMPELSGIELRKKIATIPVCVFITSYPEHAADSYEVETFDFLIKPLNFERFQSTISRIEMYFSMLHKANLYDKIENQDEIFIKEGHTQIKLNCKDILYLEALKDYTLIVTPTKKHCVLSSLGNLLKENHFNSFIRIHRSFAIQKSFIKKIGTNDIHLNNDILLPIGRSYKENLKLIV
ncbi:LytR/AlgR family response regulator transcription factor [Flavobacterium urocaniciphilum]|uniref:Two component transcriptional regulator, LytTR family n=1 Tax=Flavobacterium urocaniciphilum TaxID=1299341 RepID=A0A1H9AFL1_9FLAO|nr:LytTR family DNA-binding domain-containing protein [Flavobacterium urocaniciphilum]SEP75287.1 two component transcriptional regulator, LytTR family [Flavobacterium urocaniciphilum]